MLLFCIFLFTTFWRRKPSHFSWTRKVKYVFALFCAGKNADCLHKGYAGVADLLGKPRDNCKLNFKLATIDAWLAVHGLPMGFRDLFCRPPIFPMAEKKNHRILWQCTLTSELNWRQYAQDSTANLAHEKCDIRRLLTQKSQRLLHYVVAHFGCFRNLARSNTNTSKQKKKTCRNCMQSKS